MTKTEQATKTRLEAELRAATLPNRSVRAVRPDGRIVTLREHRVVLACTLARGFHLSGLKPNWKLATEADEAKALAEAKARKGG